MATWIFQGNPKVFDLDGYLEHSGSTITWLVRQHAADIAVGDTVFLWRAEGDGKEPGGIIAELDVVEPVSVQSDDPASARFWKDEAAAADAENPVSRVRLRLRRLASKREILKRQWLKDDAVLKTLAPLRMAQNTNYSVRAEEIPRLRALWENTGRDWSREESLAALHAYDRLFGKQISKLPDSLTSEIAQKIGRATDGVYNKLMNFRSLDPRVEQEGLKATSHVDKQVWGEFFDSGNNRLDSGALTREYERVWGLTGIPPLTEAATKAVEAEAKRLERRGLEELLRDFNAARSYSTKPPRQVGTISAYRRDARVVAITRLRANYRCEVPGCSNHQFLGSESQPYIETHHLDMLAEGGADVPENTAAVCAIHHRELHHGKQRLALTSQLKEQRSKEL